MDDGLIALFAAVTAFVGSHLLLSHALRRRMVDALSVTGFQLVYSMLSFILLLLVLAAYHQAPHLPILWASDNAVMQFVYALGSCCAAALFVASLYRNPGLVGAKITDLSTRPPAGVYLVTRHPMMFSLIVWSLLQIMITPSLRNLIVFGGFTVLALAGSRLQDRKKVAQTGREWAMWVSRTPFWPKLSRLGALGPAWLIGLILAALITAVQTRTTLTQVGLWYFLPPVF